MAECQGTNCQQLIIEPRWSWLALCNSTVKGSCQNSQIHRNLCYWLVDPGIPINEINESSSKSYWIYISDLSI